MTINNDGQNKDALDLDKVILVNSEDQRIGEIDKHQVHEHPAKLHRASSVWLINDINQVLLQKRSSKKIVGAGWWGNAICGNVRPTESYEDCAWRRLREEIGVERRSKNPSVFLNLEPIYKFSYQAYCNEKYGEHEIDQVYVGRYDGDVIINNDEVSEFFWINLDELIETAVSKPSLSGILIVSPGETMSMNLEQLKESTAPFEFEIDGKKKLLAPWTRMMLNDKRLIEALHKRVLS